MSDTWMRLWSRARDAVTQLMEPGNRHQPRMARPQWMVAVPLKVDPDARGRHWRHSVEHTQMLPVTQVWDTQP